MIYDEYYAKPHIDLYQHNPSFSKVQTCHMLAAQPSTYDMFGLIELYGRQLQSEYDLAM
jgi:hypothetical protein